MNKHVSMLEVDKQCGEKKIKHKWDQEGQRGSGSTAVGEDLTKKVRFGKRLSGGRRQLGKEFIGTGESLSKDPKAGDGLG